MKKIKTILIVLVALSGITASMIYLLSLGVGNGGLGSSYPRYTSIASNSEEKKIAYKIFAESCAAPNISADDFANGLSEEQASTCNSSPNKSGIEFVGGNGNEMYLLSHNYWDKRVLYLTYYLLQRGFGDSKYSLDMDCSANGFPSRTKMTLGVHYTLKEDQALSYIKSISDPSPNLDLQYISGSSGQSPEGTSAQVSSNSISPHAYGQALDVYSYGCTSVYVRLDSDMSASRYACGQSASIYSHSYFYPIKNIKNEIGYIMSAEDVSASPDQDSEIPSAYPAAQYPLLDKPELPACNSQPITVQTPDNLCQNDNAKTVTYTVSGCIAQDQTKSYSSSYYFRSILPGYTDSSASRVQPFQYIEATPPDPLEGDNCACKDIQTIPTLEQTSSGALTTGTTNALFAALASVPQALDYSSENLTNPTLSLAAPSDQKVIVNQNKMATSSNSTSLQGQVSDDESQRLAQDTENDLEEYIKEQAAQTRKIVLEASLIFSLARENGSYSKANEYYSTLIGDLPESEMTINQIAAPKSGNFSFPEQYDTIAKYLYGANSGTDYDPDKVTGVRRGLGYNTAENDRVHFGF